MDQLHFDTFGHEDDSHDDALFSQAQHLLRQCPCRRYKNSAARCVRCKLLLAMFVHRPEVPELDVDLPRGGKSRLEIVSFRASARPEPIVIKAGPSVELGDEIVADWSEDDAQDSAYDVGDSTHDVDDLAYGRSWEERLARLERRDARRQEELDWLEWQDIVARRNEQAETTDPGDAEDEHVHNIGRPNFGSPVLQLVWGRFLSHRQNNTNLRREAYIRFGPLHGRGTANAVGLWTNSDDGSILFKLGYWIRRQREIWFGLLFGSWKGADRRQNRAGFTRE